MKNIFITVLLIASLSYLKAQFLPRISWINIEMSGVNTGHRIQQKGLGYDYRTNFATVVEDFGAERSQIRIRDYRNSALIMSVNLDHTLGGQNLIQDMRFDDLGNLYIIGKGANLDLNPATILSSDTFYVYSNDSYLAKFSPSGNLLFAKILKQQDALSLSIGFNNDIYIASTFTGTVNADLNGGTATKVSAGGTDVLISHFNSTSNLIAAFQIGASANDNVTAIDIDVAGKIYVAGNYTTSINDFDPGASTYSLSNLGSNDIYIAKYTGNGSIIWARKISSTGNESVSSIRFNENNQLNFIGRFDGSNVNFALIGAASTLTALNQGNLDICYAVYDTSGVLKKANAIGNPTGLNVVDCSLSPYFDLFICGNFQGTYDLNPGIGTQMVTSGNSGNGTNMFFSKFDSLGVFSFGKDYYDITFPTGTSSNSYCYQIAAIGNSFMVSSHIEGLIQISPGIQEGGIGSGFYSGGKDCVMRFCAGKINPTFTIAGPTNACVGDVINYSVPPFTADIFHYWHLPSGLTSTSVFSNTIQVTVNAILTDSITLYMITRCDTVALTLPINTNCGAGIKEINSLSGIKIYPNPSNGIFNIIAEKEIGNLILMNAIGETVFLQFVSNKEFQIDLSKYAGGVYMLQMQNQHTKIIKE